MKRYRLFSPNLQELPVWKDFSDTIDEVFKDGIDDPQVVLRLLRDTFAYGPYSYQELNDPSLEEVFNIRTPTTTIYLQQIKTVYPNQTDVMVYQKATDAPDSDYVMVSVPYYQVIELNGLQFTTPLAINQTIKVVPRPRIPQGTYDVNNLYNFSGPVPDELFQVYTVQFLFQAIFVLPASKTRLVTGAPSSNRLLVYTKLSGQSDVFYQFVPPSEYTLTSAKIITFNVPRTLGTVVKIMVRPSSVEITRKLNLLGFDYNDMDFVTLPSERENSDVTQVMSDLIGNYYIHTKGKKNFASFFAYVFKALFRVDQLWAEDLGDDAYHNFTPNGSLSIGTPVWDGGTWYPTSHVEIYYDLLKFANTLNERAVTDFFAYVCPINLVVVAIVLETVVDAEVFVGAAPLPIITYL